MHWSIGVFTSIDAGLGVPDYPATKPLMEFVDEVMKKR